MQIDLSKYKEESAFHIIKEVTSDCKCINNIYNILRNICEE